MKSFLKHTLFLSCLARVFCCWKKVEKLHQKENAIERVPQIRMRINNVTKTLSVKEVVTMYSNFSNEKRYYNAEAHPTKLWPYGTTSYHWNKATSVNTVHDMRIFYLQDQYLLSYDLGFLHRKMGSSFSWNMLVRTPNFVLRGFFKSASMQT